MELVILLIGVIIGAGTMWVGMNRRVSELEKNLKRTQRELDEEEEIASGLEDFNRQMQEMKEARKERILKELAEGYPRRES